MWGKILGAATALAGVSLMTPALGHDHKAPIGEAIAHAAESWLATLEAEQAQDAEFAFKDRERRNWHFIPRSRKGLALRDMTPDQQEAARAIIATVLSPAGVEKAEAIMALELVLRELENANPRRRDPVNYSFSLFGEIGAYPWGLRIEGHHLSVNVTLTGPDTVSVTPAFAGTNPARIPSGPKKGTRVQHDEHFKGLAFMEGLDESQQGKALLRTRSYGEVLTLPGRADAISEYEGLAAPDMTPDQREKLLTLIELYVGLARDEIGTPYMAMVRDGLDQTHFAWAGDIAAEGIFYYRIHGPRVLIEFDNTQNGGNHVHALWRDPKNDFGESDLAHHYRTAAPEHGHDH